MQTISSIKRRTSFIQHQAQDLHQNQLRLDDGGAVLLKEWEHSNRVITAVRVRPMTSKEIHEQRQCIVYMTPDGSSTILTDPSFYSLQLDPPMQSQSQSQSQVPTHLSSPLNNLQSNPHDRRPSRTTGIKNIDASAFTRCFYFDYCYWSCDALDTHFATQETVYEDLGTFVLDQAWLGYNTSVFGYGQTGSGKSYSMMGLGSTSINTKSTAMDASVFTQQLGLIPRICQGLFQRIERANNLAADMVSMESFTVHVNYVEIYNETVFDLLNPRGNKTPLKVREHPETGPYVDELITTAVHDYQDIDVLLTEGRKCRSMAETNMNKESSRSHAIFTILFQRRMEVDGTVSGATSLLAHATVRLSKIHLVDLAGSERADATGADGERLREASHINKSLSALGDVIQAVAGRFKKKGNAFIPYRNSVLTRLLKESLGGNAKTIMLAAISPCDIHYDETLTTLKYIDRAKRIVNEAIVNEDPNTVLIRNLRHEIDVLRHQLVTGAELDSVLINPNDAWKETFNQHSRVTTTQKQNESKSQELCSTLPLTQSCTTPCLVNLNPDAIFSESIVYSLEDGMTTIGQCLSSGDSKSTENETYLPDIALIGRRIEPIHCIIDNASGVLTLHACPDALTFVNGKNVLDLKQSDCESSEIQLSHHDRIIFGLDQVFRLDLVRNGKANDVSGNVSNIDWVFAQKELKDAFAEGTLEDATISHVKRETSRGDKPLFLRSENLGETEDSKDDLLESLKKRLEEQRIFYEDKIANMKQKENNKEMLPQTTDATDLKSPLSPVDDVHVEQVKQTLTQKQVTKLRSESKTNDKEIHALQLSFSKATNESTIQAERVFDDSSLAQLNSEQSSRDLIILKRQHEEEIQTLQNDYKVLKAEYNQLSRNYDSIRIHNEALVKAQASLNSDASLLRTKHVLTALEDEKKKWTQSMDELKHREKEQALQLKELQATIKCMELDAQNREKTMVEKQMEKSSQTDDMTEYLYKKAIVFPGDCVDAVDSVDPGMKTCGVDTLAYGLQSPMKVAPQAHEPKKNYSQAMEYLQDVPGASKSNVFRQAKFASLKSINECRSSSSMKLVEAALLDDNPHQVLELFQENTREYERTLNELALQQISLHQELEVTKEQLERAQKKRTNVDSSGQVGLKKKDSIEMELPVHEDTSFGLLRGWLRR